MLVSELKEIAKNHSVNTTGLDKQGLISAIIENQSSGISAPAEQDGSAIKKRGRPRVTKGTIIDEPIVHGKAKEKIIQKVMAVSPIAETNDGNILWNFQPLLFNGHHGAHCHGVIVRE